MVKGWVDAMFEGGAGGCADGSVRSKGLVDRSNHGEMLDMVGLSGVQCQLSSIR